ncbi:coenzyme A transferase [Kribbella voronezhensis]|uniref:Coenzyme A transferase n=1 Tax=Kribbella voronezhensis TaxID=2512212 RepID=A0A4R7TDV9_9ACTN|nr:CoA-transferase [Kribbella voronezhensis]TDU90285.1 coenzyme A transferase [Kribbella voronezhensis]
MSDWDSADMMNVAAARELKNGDVCLVGVGPPNLAANLARRTHAPNCRLVYESGAIDAKPRRLPLSIGDDDLAATAIAVVSVPEMFNFWVGAGRIDVGFLGAAQIDRFGNINTTVIGSHAHPTTRLPGAGGAPEIAAAAGRVIVIVKQSPRTFVEQVDFVSSVGYGPTGRERRTPNGDDRIAGPAGTGPTAASPMGAGPMGAGPTGAGPMGTGPTGAGPMGTGLTGAGPMGAGLTGAGLTGDGPRGAGPTLVITDYGVLEPDPETNELTMTRLHQGVTVEAAREATGWQLKVADGIQDVPPPTETELAALRSLRNRETADA